MSGWKRLLRTHPDRKPAPALARVAPGADIAQATDPATEHPTALSTEPATKPAIEQADDAPIYRVAAGDNLRSIAEQVYGGQDAWLSIYAANRGLIGPDPNALATGAALRLPPALPGQH